MLTPVEIIDNGDLLRIVRGSRTLDIPKNDANILLGSPTSLSLFITGDDSQINEEIVFAEVTVPLTANITTLRNAIIDIINKDYRPINRFLDTIGNGAGSIDGAVDFSAVATEFFILPAATQVFDIYELLIYIQDANGLDSGRYGNNINLTNGVIILTILNSTVRLLTGE